MSTPNNRRRDPGGLSGETMLLWAAIATVAVVLAAVYAAVHLGHLIADTGKRIPTDPFAVFFGLLGGKVAWPGVAGWVVLVGILVLVIALGVLIGIWRYKAGRKRSRVDAQARYMGRGRDIEDLGRKAATAKAERLGVRGADGCVVSGLPIGLTVATRQQLLSSWEDMRITIAGPRTGKTTSMVVPEILEAPGSVLATSNKRDIVDHTRGPRVERGPVWVFDPQGVANEEPTWWWNPLSYVTNEVKAANLADHFASGSRAPGARADAYFDTAAQDLLAGLLLAAALDERPITNVFTWITRPDDDTAVDILQRHGYALIADQVAGVIAAPERQRGGVYGSAQQMVSCLTNRQVASWVNRQGDDDSRPQFSPEAFVQADGGTLYSLSREGRGTAGPLVTALTVAVVEAAEELAARSRGGRLATPLVGVLDEAANVCRWRDLPDLYSHYGSRGIVLDTVLQSWSQGVEVWGEAGMRKLWSAANVKVYGGGVSEVGFLKDMVDLIGEFDRVSSSTSYGRGQRSVSQQLHREQILGVDALSALPKGRAVVFASGSRPTLIRTVPWMGGKHDAAVRASLAKYDPEAGRTMQEADAERAAVAAAEEA